MQHPAVTLPHQEQPLLLTVLGLEAQDWVLAGLSAWGALGGPLPGSSLGLLAVSLHGGGWRLRERLRSHSGLPRGPSPDTITLGLGFNNGFGGTCRVC